MDLAVPAGLRPEPLRELFVSPAGNDAWSGRLPEPNVQRTDGPLATIAGARDRLRSLRQSEGRAYRSREMIAPLDGPVTVFVRGGRYELSGPVLFLPLDNGPVTFCAYPGETPVLDGGRRISGFRVEQVNGREAWVVDLPEVASGVWNFRELYVNGRRAIRARLPKGSGTFLIEDALLNGASAGWGQPGTDRFIAPPGGFDTWKNLSDVEVVALHFWIEERLPVVSYDPQSRLVVFGRKTVAPLVQARFSPPAPYYVENLFEALTEPGEWYLDRPAGRLYYLPHEGETLQTAEVVAPRLVQLLRIEGDPLAGKYVQGLRFEGLTFRHTDAVLPGTAAVPASLTHREDPTYRGDSRAAAWQGAADVPGVVYLRGAHHCSIEDCRVECVGWYAIELDAGCMSNRLIGNELVDLGGGGIKLNGSMANGSREGRTGNNRITDNHIHRAGRVFHSAAGILARHTFGNLIAHNHIHDLYHNGINVGWVWSFYDSIAADNLIEFNHIHDLGQGMLSDLGCIYILGGGSGNIIRGNHCHHVTGAKYGGWGIYLDEGSAHVIVENNLVHHLGSNCFHLHWGRENTVRNNIFAFGGDSVLAVSRVSQEYSSVSFTRNILLTDGGAPVYLGGYKHEVVGQRAFESDLNLVWDLRQGTPAAARNRSNTAEIDAKLPMTDWARWLETGRDRHSVVADPQFADAAAGNFELAADSPATSIGFLKFDLRWAGPRPRQAKKA